MNHGIDPAQSPPASPGEGTQKNQANQMDTPPRPEGSETQADTARSWRPNRFGHNWGHWFFYTLVRLGGKRLARPLAYFCLHFVVFFYVAFVPSVRANCRPYLRRRFPKAGPLARWAHACRLVMNQAKVLVDRAILGILGPESIQARFRSPGDLAALKELDTGFVLLMSHVGGWQVALPALGELNRRVHLLMLQERQDVNQDFHGQEKGNAPGGDLPLNIINPDQFLGGTLEMMAALKKDEVVSVMGDRLFGNPAFSLEMDFMGGPVRFPVTAFKLAATAKKPLVILTTRKSGPSQYTIAVEKILDLPPLKGRGMEKFRPFLQDYVKTLEAYAQENPFQFFNFFNMWEAPDA